WASPASARLGDVQRGDDRAGVLGLDPRQAGVRLGGRRAWLQTGRRRRRRARPRARLHRSDASRRRAPRVARRGHAWACRVQPSAQAPLRGMSAQPQAQAISAPERLLRADLEGAEFTAGADRGYWQLISLQW